MFGLAHNKPQEQAAVVIPVYRKDLSLYEQISMKRCHEVLGKHPLFFISPEGLRIDGDDWSSYGSILYFHPEYFGNTSAYNRLMFSPAFYRRFADFEYILIYQLDSFVFKDQLSYWCGLSYDYIGAPWIGLNRREEIRGLLPFWERRGFIRRILGQKISNVGNGGFSLRRVRTFLLLSALLRRKMRVWPLNEDTFWSFAAPCYFPFFRKPTTEIAIQFSFELDPRKAYELNHCELPFGCHAWWRYDFEFWRGEIEPLGYKLQDNVKNKILFQ
jgi:hypothetical protein